MELRVVQSPHDPEQWYVTGKDSLGSVHIFADHIDRRDANYVVFSLRGVLTAIAYSIPVEQAPSLTEQLPLAWAVR